MDEPFDTAKLPPVQPSGLPTPVSDDQAMPSLPQDPMQSPDSGSAAAKPVDQPINRSDVQAISMPDEAADIDLIEKEWVTKAKQIVDHTSDDPYSQQKEIAKMKAQYMKKRYNKDVEV